MTGDRGHWGSRFGFVLAAAGSAVGLGNLWKFPYITGENGGGWFVLIYLGCIVLIGLPVMMAEIMIGRSTQCSPVGAFRKLSRPGSPWIFTGWLGVAAAFVILSFYSVVAGWAMHYVWLTATQAFAGQSPQEIGDAFGAVIANPAVNVGWHVAFMTLTVLIVIGGVRGGIERWARILMPLLFVMLLALLVVAMRSDGFRPALDFVFGTHADKLKPGGVLEALGHAFFTLSLGMGGMITYGSYLRRDDDLVSTSVMVGVLDTVVALLACMVLFPIVFTYGMDPSGGPGLIFANMPIAFSQMPGGAIWAPIFFVLVVFAALTSAIALLEVATSYFIDERGWGRVTATVVCGGAITIVGIPSALTGSTALFGSKMESAVGRNWFDLFDYVASNWMLPLGGLGIALFVAWRVAGVTRREDFVAGSRFAALYWGWLQLLRYIVPIAVILVILHKIGVLERLGLI